MSRKEKDPKGFCRTYFPFAQWAHLIYLNMVANNNYHQEDISLNCSIRITRSYIKNKLDVTIKKLGGVTIIHAVYTASKKPENAKLFIEGVSLQRVDYNTYLSVHEGMERALFLHNKVNTVLGQDTEL